MNGSDTLWVMLQRRFGRQRLRRIFLGAIPFLALLAIWGMNTAFADSPTSA